MRNKFLKKHRIIVIGDSNIRGYRCNLNSLLSNNYKLYSLAKPGSNSNELHQTAKEELSQLSNNDAIVVCSGTNDYELNGFSRTWHNISSFIQKNHRTNIILINVPCRYDLPNSASINRKIAILNRKLKKLVKTFPSACFVETSNCREMFTYHGLHFNKIGKRYVTHQLAYTLQSDRN